MSFNRLRALLDARRRQDYDQNTDTSDEELASTFNLEEQELLPQFVENYRPRIVFNRRAFLRSATRIFLLLDRIVFVCILPLVFYNFAKVLMSEVSFSNDFVSDIAEYTYGVDVFSQDKKSILLYKREAGFLLKVHNIIVYHLAKFTRLMDYSPPFLIKAIVICCYVTYTLATSTYLVFGIMFFFLCFLVTMTRRFTFIETLVKRAFTSGVF